jgi:NitT/TauT family transport system permease protein
MARTYLAYGMMIVSIPVLWILAIELTGFQPFLVPPPELVLDVLWSDKAIFFHHTLVTLQGAALGYLAANVLAIAAAVLFLYIPVVEDFAEPWMVVVKNVPFVVIASIVVIILGQSIWPRVIVVVLISFFPVYANVQKGLREVDQVLLDRMASLNASKWEVFRHVRWPAAMPYYIAAHEIAFTTSVIGSIVAEWLFASEGLGYLILRSMSQYRADKVYAVTVIASVLAVVILLLIKLIERRAFRWKRSISNGKL